MELNTLPYLKQESIWPKDGRHILAQYDNNSIIVYQAYRPAIANYALKHGYFGGEFKLTRMSWIKPNFLWMMYRSGWATKPGQEIVLAVKIKISFFNSILKIAISSLFEPEIYLNKQIWKDAVDNSSVRMQWDPDHDPKGEKLNRRAIQLGLRNEILKEYSKEAIIEIIDMSDFIESQREHVNSGDFSKLETPKEEVYLPKDEEVIKKLKLSV